MKLYKLSFAIVLVSLSAMSQQKSLLNTYAYNDIPTNPFSQKLNFITNQNSLTWTTDEGNSTKTILFYPPISNNNLRFEIKYFNNNADLFQTNLNLRKIDEIKLNPMQGNDPLLQNIESIIIYEEIGFDKAILDKIKNDAKNGESPDNEKPNATKTKLEKTPIIKNSSIKNNQPLSNDN